MLKPALTLSVNAPIEVVMEYRFVEDSLAELHAVPPKSRGALRSRLRVLRDVGVPSVQKVGKGSRVDYSFDDVFEMHLGLHLEHFGYPPDRVRFVVSRLRGKPVERQLLHGKPPERKLGKLLKTYKDVSLELAGEGKTGDLWMLLWFARRRGGDLDPEGAMLPWMGLIEKLTEELRKIEAQDDPATFGAIINLTKLLRECMGACAITSF
jgi:hypothetical protein